MSTLLSQPFPGRDALTEQLQAVRVRTIDADGSLELRPTGGPRADVVRRIPVEAESFDGEGATVHLLLHVVDGQMKELEIYREDSKPPRGRLGELRLMIL